MTAPSLQQVRAARVKAGLPQAKAARLLDLKQVHGSPRTVEKWYSGKTTCRTVEYRALRDLKRGLNNDKQY